MLAKVAEVQPPPARNWQLRLDRDEEFLREYWEYEDKYEKLWNNAKNTYDYGHKRAKIEIFRFEI